ncbi:hypothetical protein P7K49_028378 [Saguinus oedipus]|uniref:RHG40/28/18 C-terminal ubiquitin-like domain-containing protein n=1 Tax=Saguinus oedipus TaxID=9490 RepID=A0ABQ9UC88_SAGOE|nr:hypothetical protein P7K49_028378 [Saguinus oedipus]
MKPDFFWIESNVANDKAVLNIQLLREHCLDPDAYILDVYRINPQAEWVIKPQESS